MYISTQRNRTAFLLLVHNEYAIKDELRMSHASEDQSEWRIIECLDNTCVEACYMMWCDVMWCHRSFSSSTEQSTSSRLMRRHRRRRRKTKPPRMERVRQLMHTHTHTRVQEVSIMFGFHCVPRIISFSSPCSVYLSQSSSFSSITDSTMSLNIITVTLNMGEYHTHICICTKIPIQMLPSSGVHLNVTHNLF